MVYYKVGTFWVLPIWFLIFLHDDKLWVNAKPQVPCYFIFGDSLSDSGNNNYLRTLAKVNYRPYGTDFPKGPTGRFSNGRTKHDFIVEYLGFKDYIVPFAMATGQSIYSGVNYASGSCGIDDETGRHLGKCISLSQQLRNHKTIISQINRRLGKGSNNLLSKCIYTMEIGNNDYLNNYFVPNFYNSSRQYTVWRFTRMLLRQYSQQIKDLYEQGARKFALYGLGPLGCAPYTRSMYGNDAPFLCADKLNIAADLFNVGLLALVRNLNKNLTDATFTYLNPTANPLDIVPFVIGKPCCEIGAGEGELCVPNSKPCENRDKYAFWDGVHPTEAWNAVMAKNAYQSNLPVIAIPYNIQKLVQI